MIKGQPHPWKGSRFPDFKEILERYKDTDFGTYTVQTIDISTRFHYDDDGFYEPYFRMPLYDKPGMGLEKRSMDIE